MGTLEVRGLKTVHGGPVDLAVDAGECVALSGPSGAGKTLLLRAIADLDRHEGGIFLGGTGQADLSGPAWRRRVGYLPAESHWWADGVGEHFDEAARARAAAALSAIRLDPQALEWRVDRLSVGERQRLALLRLLVREPDALLLDEPTANLDPDSTAAVEGLIAAYRAERRAPVLWVCHDAGQRERVAGRQYRMEEGRILP